MAHSGLDRFGAYRKSLELLDLVVEDIVLLQKDTRCYRLISQQVGSADSICANIEEGYGRLSRREYVRFLDFARGSARETQGRCGRIKHWLGPEVISQRTALCGEIIAILTSSTKRLQSDLESGFSPSAMANRSQAQNVKETDIEHGHDLPPLTLDTTHFCTRSNDDRQD